MEGMVLKTYSKLLICWLSTLQSGEAKIKVADNTSQRPCIPYIHGSIFLANLKTPCRRSKWSARKNIQYISKVVTLEATAKYWGMEYRRKRWKERTRWTRSKYFPVNVDVLACYSSSINFCAFFSSWCCIIVASLPSPMIICSFYSRFCTSSSSSCWSTKASWSSLGDLIYHLFGTDLLQSIFDCPFRKYVLLVLQQCRKDCFLIGGKSKPFVDRWPYLGVFNVWGDIGLCHWPRRWVDGAQCTYKCWFVL